MNIVMISYCACAQLLDDVEPRFWISLVVEDQFRLTFIDLTGSLHVGQSVIRLYAVAVVEQVQEDDIIRIWDCCDLSHQPAQRAEIGKY